MNDVPEQSVTVAEAAPMIHPDLLPRQLSDFLYRCRLARDFRVVGGRKQIPLGAIDALRHELRRAGRLPAEGMVAHA